MLTREQDQFIEGLMLAYGGVKVFPMPSWAHLPGVEVQDVVAVPWVDGHQVSVPMFVPADVCEHRLARAASSSEIQIAQDAARRGAQA